MKTSNPDRPTIGGIRIGIVKYEFHTIQASKHGVDSIGNMIDRHISDTIAKGDLINEVSLFFETREQQEALADLYRLAQ